MVSIKLGKKVLIPSKIVCVGRNYALHASEMGVRQVSAEPIIFIKPNSSLVYEPKQVFIPEELGLLHYEVEMCFIVRASCKDVPVKKARPFIGGITVGIDFTLRDMQSKAKQAGLPWTLAKGFDQSAPIGRFTEVRGLDLRDIDIMLAVDDEVRQSANTREMIFSCEEILAFASKYMTLEEGDIFMTGTPGGVGEAKDGQKFFAQIVDLPPLEFVLVRKGRVDVNQSFDKTR